MGLLRLLRLRLLGQLLLVLLLAAGGHDALGFREDDEPEHPEQHGDGDASAADGEREQPPRADRRAHKVALRGGGIDGDGEADEPGLVAPRGGADGGAAASSWPRQVHTAAVTAAATAAGATAAVASGAAATAAAAAGAAAAAKAAATAAGLAAVATEAGSAVGSAAGGSAVGSAVAG